jgi:hypothetical protein
VTINLASPGTSPPGSPSKRPRLGTWSRGVPLCPCKTGFGRVRDSVATVAPVCPRTPGPWPRAAGRRAPAEKYRNRDGNQQTPVDLDGRITTLQRGVFKRQCVVSSRWHAEGPSRRNSASPFLGSGSSPRLASRRVSEVDERRDADHGAETGLHLSYTGATPPASHIRQGSGKGSGHGGGERPG